MVVIRRGGSCNVSVKGERIHGGSKSDEESRGNVK